jgi:P-type Ca2+ transporter type 2C
MDMHRLSVEKVADILQTNIKNGLNNSNVKLRQKKYGLNIISEDKGQSMIAVFCRQFLSPLMFILLIAAFLSIAIKEYSDAVVIGIAVFLNVIIGFVQEWKAERVALKLKAYEVPKCIVRRNGEIFSIDAKNLVPGDIVILPSGSRVPADMRLFYVADFRVEEAILTGESKAVVKKIDLLSGEKVVGDRTNMAYAGTYVVAGKAEGIVVAIGKKTQLGEIANLVVKTKDEQTPLQKQIKHLSWILGAIMVSVTGFVFVLGLIKGVSLKEILPVSIALAVAAIPEGLLVAMTVVLAIGMRRMLKRKALVRHLVAAETLGSVSVICTDKTGTLTQGKMAVAHVVTRENDFAFRQIKDISKNVNELFLAATLNNDAQLIDHKQRVGLPTELALLEAAYHLHIDIEKERLQYPRIAEVSFSSDLKYMVTAHQLDHKSRVIMKGAQEKVFEKCSMSDEEKKYFQLKANEMTQKGLRVLAIASKDFDDIGDIHFVKDLKCIGLVGLQDPLREHAVETIRQLKKAGIKVVLVTGDHKDTAINIARGAGIFIRDNGVMSGLELDKKSDKDFIDIIKNIDVFVRVEPRHKIRIVNAWQKQNAAVAMTGDGVNDAPALKAADIGVALGSGSDVAHEISDMVLLNNDLSTITAAVKEGRTIFDNIRKIIVYLLADSFCEIILIVGALLVGMPMPLLAVQILWINLASDGLPYLALTVEPSEPEIMSEQPRKKTESILNTEMKTIIFIIGIITDIGLFGLYWILYKFNFDLLHIRTIIFTALAIDSFFYVFSIRSIRKNIFRVNLFKNRWLVYSVVLGILIQVAVVYIPFLQKLFYTVSLGLFEWGIILGLALVKIVGIEFAKDWFIIKKKV